MTLEEMIKALEAKLKALQASATKGFKDAAELKLHNDEMTSVMLQMATIFTKMGEDSANAATKEAEFETVKEQVKTLVAEIKTVSEKFATAVDKTSHQSRFATIMRAIQTGDLEGLKAARVKNTVNEQGSKAFTVSTEVVKAGVGATDGGYFIEPELSDTILMDSMEYTTLGPLLTHIPMRTTVISWKHFDYASMEAVWFTDDTDISVPTYTEKGDAKFNQRVSLKAYTCAAFHTYFDLFQEDLQFNIKIATLMLQAFAEWRAGELDRLVINGKGGVTDPFTGLLADEAMNNRVSRKVSIAGNTAYDVTDKEWRNLRRSIKKQYRKNAKLLIHSTVVDAYSYRKDEMGRPFVSVLDGVTTIFGMTVIECDEMPDIDEVEAGGAIAWFGSLKNCLYGTLSGLEIRTFDGHVRNLENGEVATRFRERYGIKWVNPHHGSFLKRKA